MKHLIAPLALTLIAGAAAAQEQKAGLASFDMLAPDTAMTLARAAFDHCRGNGYQVAVVVVDRFGTEQVVLRDRFAGAHTIPTATGKAWTSASFRAGTLDLAAQVESGELARGLRDVPGALFLGGGLPVEAAGSIVGGIGVSGAPDPQIDQDCAQAGLDAIFELLEF